MALLAVVLCVNLAACSNDDENDSKGESKSLAGTSWKVTSVDKNDTESQYLVGKTLSFNKDGSITTTPDQIFFYLRWEQSGNKLLIVYGSDDYPDDCVAGTFSINGKICTYKYNGYDYGDDYWEDEKSYTMTLQKQ